MILRYLEGPESLLDLEGRGNHAKPVNNYVMVIVRMIHGSGEDSSTVYKLPVPAVSKNLEKK